MKHGRLRAFFIAIEWQSSTRAACARRQRRCHPRTLPAGGTSNYRIAIGGMEQCDLAACLVRSELPAEVYGVR